MLVVAQQIDHGRHQHNAAADAEQPDKHTDTKPQRYYAENHKRDGMFGRAGIFRGEGMVHLALQKESWQRRNTPARGIV